jgi:endonuclease YncB( thermonuclease family)
MQLPPVSLKDPAKAQHSPLGETKQRISGSQNVKVMKVLDGDSLIVRDQGGLTFGLRLHGIDAPEYKQAHGKRARRELDKLVSGQSRATISIETWSAVDTPGGMPGTPRAIVV